MNNRNRYSSSGNVLFLILIAVALLCGLVMAMSTSMRSGTGNKAEKNTLDSSALVLYPSTISQALQRMTVYKNYTINGSALMAEGGGYLHFTPPVGFAGMTQQQKETDVFHPEGGGATYQTIPADTMANGQQGTWYINVKNQIEGLGAVSGQQDLIIYAPGIRQDVCRSINEKLKLGTTIPDEDSGLVIVYNIDKTNPYETTGGTIGDGGSVLEKATQGCFSLSSGAGVLPAGTYVYFYVLKEF